jgi:hypothetical protein
MKYSCKFCSTYSQIVIPKASNHLKSPTISYDLLQFRSPYHIYSHHLPHQLAMGCIHAILLNT